MKYGRRQFGILVGGALATTFFPRIASSNPKKDTLERFLHREYKRSQKRAKTNNEYLINQVYLRDDVYSLCKNPEQAQRRIITQLQDLEHTHRDSKIIPSRDIELLYYEQGKRKWFPYTYTETPEIVGELTPRQLVRVHLFLDALQNTNFPKELGVSVEQDIKNTYGEHGGLLFYDGRVYAKDIPSRYNKEKSRGNNRVYGIPRHSLYQPHLGVFHIHAATNDETLVAGPSIKDIKHYFGEAADHGESHNLVISKLQGKKINVDFLSIEFDKSIAVTIVDLGNYSY